MRKIALAIAVAATLPSLTAGDPPKEANVRRSSGGTKVPDKRDAAPAAAEVKVQKPGSKQAGKFSPSQTQRVQKPGAKETIKLNQSKPIRNAGVKEPGKLEQAK